MRNQTVLLVIVALTLAGCEASYHTKEVRKADDADRLTVGTVQKEIHKGMSGADVATALGSPNIVTTDEKSREVWIYDRMATEVVASGSKWFVTAGASRSTQRTLTVVVRFDEGKLVREVAYHQSQF